MTADRFSVLTPLTVFVLFAVGGVTVLSGVVAAEHAGVVSGPGDGQSGSVTDQSVVTVASSGPDVPDGRDGATASGDGEPDRSDADNRTVQDGSALVITSVDAPETIGEGSNFQVEYTVENTGDETATDIVALRIGGEDESTDNDVLQGVTPGGTATGTLTFASVDSRYDVGETFAWSVSLGSSGSSELGETRYGEPATLTIASVGAPETVAPGDSFEASYTIENTGDESGTDIVALRVGSESAFDETDKRTVGPGESVSGTLSGDIGDYEAGETFAWNVSLFDAGDSQVGETTVSAPEFTVQATAPAEVDISGTLDVEYTVQNVGSATGTTTVELLTDGQSGPSEAVTVDPGTSESGTLSFGAVDEQYEPGGTIGWTVDIQGDSDSGTTGVAGAPATFGVSIVGTNGPVTGGESLEVSAEIENTGGQGTQTVGLDVQGLGSDLTEVTLGGGESTTVTLAVATGDGDAGDYTATVTSENETDSQDVSVLSAAGSFEVTGVDTTDVTEGQQLVVTAEITNTGGQGTQTVELGVPGLANGQDEATVSLDGGESTTVTLVAATQSGDAGEYTATVGTGDDEASVSVTVSPEGTFAVSILGADTPTEGEVLSVGVTVENTGGSEQTQTITLDVPGLGGDETELTLAGGESVEETLAVATGAGDEGAYTATVESADDTERQAVSVVAPGPVFAVSAIEATDVVAGEAVAATIEVTNTGGESGTQTLTLSVEGLGANQTELTLAGGESTTEMLTVATGAGDAGEYTATAGTDDDEEGFEVSVFAEQNQTQFTVSITDTRSPLEGDDIEVTAEISNIGGTEETQTVELVVGTGGGGLGANQTELTLAGGESATETLTVATGDGDAGAYNATVVTADDQETAELSVLDPAAFTVSVTNTSSPVEGDDIEVTAEISNTGDVEDTQTAALAAGALGTAETSLTLAGGESTSETLTVATGDGDAGDYTATIATDDDEDSRAVTVLEPAEFVVSGVESSETVGGAELAVTVTVENVGDVEATQTVTLATPGFGNRSTALSLAGDESNTTTLSVPTETGDAGEYTVTVSVGDEEVTETVVVSGDTSSDDGATPSDGGDVAGDDGATPSDGGDVAGDDGGGFGTSEMAAVGGGGGLLLLLLGAYVIANRSSEEETTPRSESPVDTPDDESESPVDTPDDESESPVDTPDDESTVPDASQSSDSGVEERIDDCLDDVTARLDEARQARNGSEYTRALTLCERAIDTAQDGRETVREDASQRADELEEALERAVALRDSVRNERDRRQRVTDTLARADNELDDAAVALDDGDHGDAFGCLDDAAGALADATAGVADVESSNLAGRVESLERRHDRLRERARAQQEARERVTTRLDSIEEDLDTATDALADGAPAEALDMLSGTAEALDTAREPVEEHDLGTLAERIVSLERRHEELRQEARDASERVPGTVPDVPEMSLSYTDIEKGNLLGQGGNADVFTATTAISDDEVTLALKEPRVNDIVHAGTVERMLVDAQTRMRDDSEFVVSVMDTQETSNLDEIIAAAETWRRLDEQDTLVAVIDEDNSGTIEQAVGTAETWVHRDDEETIPTVVDTLQTRAVTPMMGEAETWQKLDDHDHIVTVVDYGDEPVPWIAMEYMDGGHLGRYAGMMDLDQALWTAIATTEGVRHAHDHGVAHFDLKPQNVLLKRVEGAWDVPKVGDWGLSKHLLDHSHSVEGMSPGYAAPEQFDTEEFGRTDNVTDIYQLGAVFYELFTGRPPFEGSFYQVSRKVQTETPTPPSEIADVPSELDDILLTALATEREDRHEHVLYLRDALQELRESRQ